MLFFGFDGSESVVVTLEAENAEKRDNTLLEFIGLCKKAWITAARGINRHSPFPTLSFNTQ